MLKGRKWYPTTTQTTVKISRSAKISQKEPARTSCGRELTTGLEDGVSVLPLPAEDRLGALEGLAMFAPYEMYEGTIRDAPKIRNVSSGVIKFIVPKPV